MGLKEKLFAAKYDDQKLTRQIELAWAEDPRMAKASDLMVESAHGVVRLSGRVDAESVKSRAETVA